MIVRSFSVSLKTLTPLEEAARLTDAQRRAVRSGRIERGRGYWPLRNALIDRGLFAMANGTPVLTAWGLRIQRLVKEDVEA